MAATINVNPVATTNAAGSFSVSTVGLIQGTAYDDPAVRNELAGGVLASGETLPMWGGVGIYELIASGTAGYAPNQTGVLSSLGSIVGRATAATGSKALTGFSVFNQAHAMINTPQSPVPAALNGMNVEFYRFGSNARIAVACDPSLASLEGGITTAQVSWDYVNQLLVPYTGTLTVSSGTYNNTTGATALTTSAPHGLGPGDSIVVSSLTGSSITGQNGTFTLLAGTTGSTLNYNPGAGLGATTITGGSAASGGGSDSAINVRVLQVEIGNSMTVNYNATNEFVTWNRSGSCAVILI